MKTRYAFIAVFAFAAGVLVSGTVHDAGIMPQSYQRPGVPADLVCEHYRALGEGQKCAVSLT